MNYQNYTSLSSSTFATHSSSIFTIGPYLPWPWGNPSTSDSPIFTPFIRRIIQTFVISIDCIPGGIFNTIWDRNINWLNVFLPNSTIQFFIYNDIWYSDLTYDYIPDPVTSRQFSLVPDITPPFEFTFPFVFISKHSFPFRKLKKF